MESYCFVPSHYHPLVSSRHFYNMRRPASAVVPPRTCATCDSSMRRGDQSNVWVMGSHLHPGGWEGVQLQLRARCFKRLRAAKTPAVSF